MSKPYISVPSFFQKPKNIPENIFKYRKKLYFCRIKLLDIQINKVYNQFVSELTKRNNN